MNLPEVVKGALFARYSRTTKSLRRLFLDEFAEERRRGDGPTATRRRGTRGAALRAGLRGVRRRLGGAARRRAPGVRAGVAAAGKALEWGRLAAYLEQSTRYMRYDDRPGGRVARDGAARDRGHAARGPLPSRTSTRCSVRTAACTSRWRPTSGSGSRRTTPTPTSSTARRSWPRRATRSACCCRPGPGRTWGSTPRASPTNSS